MAPLTWRRICQGCDLPILLSLALLYVALAKVGNDFIGFSEHPPIALVWLPGGLALAALLLEGGKYWPAVFIGALAAGLTAGEPIGVAVGTALGNTLETLLAAFLLTRSKRFSINLALPRDFIWLGLATAVCACVGAVIGVASILSAEIWAPYSFATHALHWWQRDVLGIFLSTPFILVWRKPPADPHIRRRIVEAVILFLLAFLTGQVIFLGWFSAELNLYAKGFWMFALVSWSAVRFGRHGAVLVIGLTAIQSFFSATLKIGYFANDLSETNFSNLWSYLIALNAVGITLALRNHMLYISAKQQRQYATFFDLTRDLQCIAGKDGYLKKVNPAFSELLGYSEHELLNRPFFELIVPEDREPTRRQIENRFRGAALPDFENRYYCKDGSIRWLSWKSSINPEDGLIYATARDITDRKRLQKKQLLMMLDAFPEAMLLVDEQGRITFANNVALTLLGYLHTELLGLSVERLVPVRARADHAKWRTDFTHAGRSRPMNNPLTALRKDGAEIPVEITLASLKLDNQDMVVAIIHDLTERNQYLEEIHAAHEFNRQIVASAQEGIIVYDLEGRFQIWNLFMEGITGISAADCLGKLPQEIFPFLLDTTILEGIERALAGETVKHPPFPWKVVQTGRSGWASCVQSPLRNPTGEIIGVIEAVNDITDLIQIQNDIRASEERFRLITETVSEVFWMVDSNFNKLYYVSPVYEKIWQRSCDELYRNPDSFMEAIHPDDRENVRRMLGDNKNSGLPFECEFRIVRPDGGTRWIYHQGFPVRQPDSSANRYVGVAQDITERKQVEQELQMANLVYRAIGEAIMVADTDNRIIAVNPAFTQLTGYTEKEAIGQPTTLLKSGHQDQMFYKQMWEVLEKTGRWHGEIVNRRKDGELYQEWLAINTVYDDHGAVQQRIATFSDMSEQKRVEQTIWQQANFDPLTGLPNRSMFHDRLKQEIKKTQRANLTLALLFLDLDHFKEVNDTLGHQVGDQLLKETAQRLRHCLRSSDTVARLGGDEFVVILPELRDPSNIDRVARSIVEQLNQPFNIAAELIYVSTSIGITFYPDDATDMDTLIKNADQAMYAAKEKGRNGYSFFSPTMQVAAQERMRLANDLRGALANNQFGVVYQPIVELATGSIHKAEALLRWRHPTRGPVSPAEFIPLAEEIGLIVAIGDWVFQHAAQQLRHCQQNFHPEFQISVNKSPVQFQRHESSHIEWSGYLQSLGLSAQSLIVEITEGLLLTANDITRKHLLSLRDDGIQVAIDDFGTGYSSLSYLKKFDIDYLKIDKMFTHGLTHDSDDRVLCEAIVTMAHKLGLKVIAEGVETEQQRDLLLNIGCDYGQGYLFAKPMPKEEFESFMENKR